MPQSLLLVDRISDPSLWRRQSVRLNPTCNQIVQQTRSLPGDLIGPNSTDAHRKVATFRLT